MLALFLLLVIVAIVLGIVSFVLSALLGGVDRKAR